MHVPNVVALSVKGFDDVSAQPFAVPSDTLKVTAPLPEPPIVDNLTERDTGTVAELTRSGDCALFATADTTKTGSDVNVTVAVPLTVAVPATTSPLGVNT
jgi:hypothetical protein